MRPPLVIIGAVIAMVAGLLWGIMVVSTKCYDPGYSHSPFDGTLKWTNRLGAVALLGIAMMIMGLLAP